MQHRNAGGEHVVFLCRPLTIDNPFTKESHAGPWISSSCGDLDEIQGDRRADAEFRPRLLVGNAVFYDFIRVLRTNLKLRLLCRFTSIYKNCIQHGHGFYIGTLWRDHLWGFVSTTFEVVKGNPKGQLQR